MAVAPGSGRLAGAIGLVVVLGLVGAAAWMLDQDPDRLAAKGQQALDRHDLAAAEASYRRALVSQPTHIPALAGLGWTYLLADQGDAAAASFDRCIDLDDDAAECLRGAAACAMRRGEAGKARTLLQRGLAATPDDPGIQSSLALLELTEGDLASASDRYESLVRRFPDKAEYALGLVETRLRQDRLDEALTAVDAALRLDDTPVRYVAMLHMLRARVLLASVAGRVDPARCAETVPPVMAWLDAADASIAQVEATGVRMPNVGKVQRNIGRMRGNVEDTCPGEVAVMPAGPTSTP